MFFDYNPGTAKTVVHYYNANGWSNPYIYYYDGDNKPVTWPGTAMTNDGNGWYSYTLSGMSQAKVIFSDKGANQYPAQNQPGLDVSGEKWFANGNCYDSEPEAITVHFQNYDNWNNVNIYYYNGEREGTSWTGVPMSADGDGWYTYKIFDYNEARVLFNNGNGTQIPPAMEPGFLVSGEMWYRNGTWTTERPEEITVYFYKPDNWSAPNIYYYKNDSDTGPAWPGTAMQQVQDNWYTYTITKYSEAKVMFNSGSNQIPAQNQPGLDAKGTMWYKDGVWCDMETDTDNDSLPDYMELVFGTNRAKADTDNDGLPDGYEVYTLGTDPTKADSDGNGKNDGAEDADNDGLTNLKEYQLGTDPTKADSDNDGLKDGEEVNTYKTDPLKKDTDGDTLSDGDDVELGFSPLLKDTDGNGILDCDEKLQQSLTQEIDCEEKPQVTDVTVSFEGSGNINSNTTITDIFGTDVFVSETVGLVGAPVEIESSSKFDTAVITFKYDETQLGDTAEENLSVMWYDEENNRFQLLDEESIVDTENNTVSATTTHFSKYLLVDRQVWYDAWKDELPYTRLGSNGIDFAFVVDVSGSMRGDRLEKAKEALNLFADTLTENDTKSLITFSHKVTTVSYISDTIDEFKEKVSGLTAGGGTSMNAGLNEGLKSVCGRENSASKEKIIVLLCDGDVENCDNIILNAVYYNVKIYTINVVEAESTRLKDMAERTQGKYYEATTSNQLNSIFNQIFLDMDTTDVDTDGDGLPDILETQGMRAINGRVYYSNPNAIDSDNDGVSDGGEMGIPNGDNYQYHTSIRQIYIGGGEYKYHIAFDAVSDPMNADSDGDGMLDSEDPAPLEIGIGDGIIGELTIVSTSNGLGHSFLVYKSYIDDILDFHNFYSGHVLYKDPNSNSPAMLSYISNPQLNRYYKIDAGDYVTIGLAGDESNEEVFKNSLSDFFQMSVGEDRLTKGGIRFNWELDLYQTKHSDNQTPNLAISKNITQKQLDDLVKFWNVNNYYNLFYHNCTVLAITSWNLIPGDFILCTTLPCELKGYIQQRDNNFEIDVSYIYNNLTLIHDTLEMREKL